MLNNYEITEREAMSFDLVVSAMKQANKFGKRLDSHDYQTPEEMTTLWNGYHIWKGKVRQRIDEIEIKCDDFICESVYKKNNMLGYDGLVVEMYGNDGCKEVYRHML